MEALWLENNKISLRDVAQPRKPDEALIEIRKAGICSTDLELVKGYYPYTGILGHEFVGEVMEAEDASWIGQRVIGEINVVCNQCEQCLNGRSTHCEKRTVLGIVNRDGTFAEYTQLPISNLHRVPDSVPDEMAVFTEPLGAALEIKQQVQVKPTDRVLLIGAGRLGQLIAQTLALTGCDLRVVARHRHQQDLLKARGIRIIAEEEIQSWRWDIVVEATGSPSGFSLARQAIRPRGEEPRGSLRNSRSRRAARRPGPRAARELERNAQSVEFLASDVLEELAETFGAARALTLIETILDNEDRLTGFHEHWKRWRRIRADRRGATRLE